MYIRHGTTDGRRAKNDKNDWAAFRDRAIQIANDFGIHTYTFIPLNLCVRLDAPFKWWFVSQKLRITHIYMCINVWIHGNHSRLNVLIFYFPLRLIISFNLKTTRSFFHFSNLFRSSCKKRRKSEGGRERERTKERDLTLMHSEFFCYFDCCRCPLSFAHIFFIRQ